MLEKLKALWKKIKSFFKKKETTSHAVREPEIVEPTPVPKPITPPEVVTIGRESGNEVNISRVTDNFLRGSDGYSDPIRYDPKYPAVDRTGFDLHVKGSPKVNVLMAGQTYQFSFTTEKDEQIKVTLLEVAGTPDSLNTTSWVSTASGFNVSPTVVFNRFGGTHDFKSPGGLLILWVIPSETAPVGVQRF